MSQIILDFGSANSCHNDKYYIKRMYDELKAVDTGKHNIVVKWQLFEKAGDNIPLLPEIFDYAYQYGTSLGYKVTSSVFDKNSLDFLLEYDIPFVKIANNRKLDWLIGEIPRKIPVYISRKYNTYDSFSNIVDMYCVSKYPATLEEYESLFITEERYGVLTQDKQFCEEKTRMYLKCSNLGVSDHTTNFDLFHKYQPKIIEWHYVLEHDNNNLDGGLFARTPEQLAEIL